MTTLEVLDSSEAGDYAQYNAIESIEFVDPDGVRLEIPWLQGVTGRGLPPVRPQLVTPATRHGDVWVDARYGARTVSIPIHLSNEGDWAQLRRDWRRMSWLVAPHRGSGILRVATVAGDQRDLNCRYLSGLELLEVHAWQQPIVLVFMSDGDPFWYDTPGSGGSDVNGQPTEGSEDWAPVPADLDLAFFTIPNEINGVEMGGSFVTLAGDAAAISDPRTITIGSDLEVWPTVTITGPGTDPLVTAGTDSFQLITTLAAGDVITVNTRERTITNQNGDNLYSSLVGELFALQPGQTTVEVTMSGTDGDSRLSLGYAGRWLTV